FASGKSDGWEPHDLPDTLLRKTSTAVLVAGQGERRKGTVFTYDRQNARLIEYDKASGDYLGQYRLAGGDEGWQDLRGFYVLPGVEEGPPTAFWISSTALHQAVLEPVSDGGAASPSASPAGSSGPGSSASAKPSTEPTATP
ncbi:MAG TPA: hypothetical protein VM408_01510, partial [Methylomirabilota bacterium]|nr:hypothetical protein [Methylomirabilota bacterium]